MQQRWILMLAALVIAALAPVLPAQEAATESRWEKAIQAFEERDRENPPKPGGAVFIGSSSIRGWKTDEYFPNHHVINRGFGGSQIADSVEFAHRIITPYKPKIVVLYAGDNDLRAGKSPQQVHEDFQQFVETVRADLPEAKVVFIAIKPSISRISMIDKVHEANALIQETIREGENLVYVDIATPMVDEEGQPREEFFAKDGLHLNPDGFALWTSLVEPHLDEVALPKADQ